MQIPLMSGVVASERADFDISLPINLEPVPTSSGISKGYMRSAMGAVPFSAGPAGDRGGIAWNGVLYRVMGTKLLSVAPNGAATLLADVGGAGPVAMDYGFDRLAIQSGTNLYYWNGNTLTHVADPDLGPCFDLVWMDGYYISTDGTSIVVTDLADPTSINPLKYGSAEADPDMIVGLLRYRSELVALGSNTVEFYTNVGGSGFPFQVNTGATISKGCVGKSAKCLYSQGFAFVGGGRNEAAAVWLSLGSTPAKLSTRAIDDMIAAVVDPSSIQLEARVSRDEERLYVHLPDRTLVYLFMASRAAQEPVWYVCRSGRGMDKPYRPRNAVLCYGKWIVGDAESAQLGALDDAIASHFGEAVGWRLDTQLLYNSAKSGIVHTLELVGLPGRGVTGPASAFLSYTLDGATWSLERANRLPSAGQRTKRVQWSPHKRFRNYMGLRFRGDSDSLAGWAALEAEIEGLSA